MAAKTQTINGLKFKRHMLLGREVWRTTLPDQTELQVAFSNADPLVTGKPLGWYFDADHFTIREKAYTSRSANLYFDSIEAAVAACVQHIG